MNRIEELLKWTLPEYRGRHIFVVKLRLVVFIGFWGFYLFFLHSVLSQTKIISAIILGCFFLSLVTYSNVKRNRWLIPSFVVEPLTDLTAITTIIYMTGGPYSPYYTIFVFYIFAAGIFYNYVLAGLIALGAAVWYGGFLFLCRSGIISPLLLDFGDRPPPVTSTPLAFFLFTAIFLGFAVYAVRIASLFSQRRERELEARNKEFAALYRMSSTIRSTLSLAEVIDRLLLGVLEGLNFEIVGMLQFEAHAREAKVRLSTPRGHPRVALLEKALGFSLDHFEFPLKLLDGPLLHTILDRRIAYRRSLIEVAKEIEGDVRRDRYQRAEEVLGVKRVVIVPVVAGETVLGALVGLSRKPFVEDASMERLEAFANQAALLLEAALLIEKLRKANERLEEANRVKSEFLATMSHELRTPLTAIIGFSELLIEGVMGELSTEQRESVQEVLHNGTDLLELINSLLDLAKLESGKMTLDVHSFSLPGLIQRVRRMVDSLIQRKRQRVTIVGGEGMPSVEGDERKIQQVILNLLSNAIKFTPEEGAIEIAMKSYDSWKAIEEASGWGAKVQNGIERFRRGAYECSISDSGIGIAPEELEAVFESFHQVDSSMTRTFGGTGLGLTLAKQFIEMHGGMIWAESTLGVGSRLVFVVPHN